MGEPAVRFVMECLEGVWEPSQDQTHDVYRGRTRFTLTSLVNPEVPDQVFEVCMEWIQPTPSHYVMVAPAPVVPLLSDESSSEEVPSGDGPEEADPSSGDTTEMDPEEEPTPGVDASDAVGTTTGSDAVVPVASSSSAPSVMDISSSSSSSAGTSAEAAAGPWFYDVSSSSDAGSSTVGPPRTPGV